MATPERVTKSTLSDNEQELLRELVKKATGIEIRIPQFNQARCWISEFNVQMSQHIPCMAEAFRRANRGRNNQPAMGRALDLAQYDYDVATKELVF